jgi:hypothetical protein
LTLFVKTVSVSLVLVSFVVIPGCTITPLESEKTIPVYLFSLSDYIFNTCTLLSIQSIRWSHSADRYFYGLSSDPSMGIDTITFFIGLPLQARIVDLSRMEIVFSTKESTP